MPPRTSHRRLALAALAFLAGCGDPDESIALVPVKGTVYLSKDPLPNASITFIPDPSNPQQTPGGDTSGSDGSYLANFKGRVGLAPGKYKAIVTPGQPPDEGGDADSVVMEAFKDDPIMLAEMRRGAAAGRAGKKGAKKPPPPEEFEVEVPAGGVERDLVLKQAVAK